MKSYWKEESNNIKTNALHTNRNKHINIRVDSVESPYEYKKVHIHSLCRSVYNDFILAFTLAIYQPNLKKSKYTLPAVLRVPLLPHVN